MSAPGARAAARALIDGGGDRDAIRALILDPCPDAPPVLAQEAASRITANGRDALPGLVRTVWPVLDPLAEAGEAQAVLLLVVLRAFLGGRMTEARVAALHLAAFPRMPPAHLSLPYSTLFDADAFGANAADLLARYPDWASARELGLAHLLLLEWLSGRRYVEASDLLTRTSGPLGPGEAAAARMLALRLGCTLPGGDAAMAAAARDVAAERGVLAPARPARRLGARAIGRGGWQALQMARARLAPALHLGRSVRLALCVSGQLRGHRAAWESWRRHLLTGGVEACVVVHSWRAIGRADAQPQRAVLPFAGARFTQAWRAEAAVQGFEAARAAHPALMAALAQGGEADAEALRALYATPHVVLEDDAAPPFARLTNQEKMHAKIDAADRLARSLGAFDLHMRIRPDLPVRARAFDWRDMAEAARARPVVFAEKALGVHYGAAMIGDQCAIGAPGPMAIHAGTARSFAALAAARPMGCPAVLTGHASLAAVCWTRGVGVARAPLRFGPLLEAAPMSPADVLAALEADGARGPLLAAARADARDEGAGAP